MRWLGLALYYVTRVHARFARRFWQWTIGTYVKSSSKSCGSVKIYGHGRFINLGGLSIGENVHVNYGATWVCDGGLTIGDNVHFSFNSTIYTRNHNANGRALPYDDENIARPVFIGRNVWIGANVTILPGARIGEGVIVGAGAVVHGEVPDFTILGAAAPVAIASRDQSHYADLDAKGHYGGEGGKLIVRNGSSA
jgi:acetyltransferase-like isoleucine patch superfamily enzyme